MLFQKKVEKDRHLEEVKQRFFEFVFPSLQFPSEKKLLKNIRMDKITYTQAGLAFMEQNMGRKPSLPVLHSHLQADNNENRSIMRHSASKGKLDVASLRHILKDETIAEVNRLKEQTKTRAYLHVKQELMKDIAGEREFLNNKAEGMVRKMLADQKNRQFLQTEIGKGRNYLSKLVGEHANKMSQDEKLLARLREKVRPIL